VSRFEELFRQMWINNGNELSKMYAGTAALQGGSKVLGTSHNFTIRTLICIENG
jgi:hypothetical protein